MPPNNTPDENTGSPERDDHLDRFESWSAANEITDPASQMPVAVRLGDVPKAPPNDHNELLKNRYLCREGGMLLVGPTGIGKSSLSMQLMIGWALGDAMFGIKPSRPLRSLLVQAENDHGDIAEMRDGVIRGLDLLPEEAEQACANVIVCHINTVSGVAFLVELEKLLARHRPDTVWIDPALAFLGGEGNSQKDVSAFVRNGINPLLSKYGCGCIIVHHTNKPPSGQQKPNWEAGDFAYLGSGSAEWANWARAIIVVRDIGSHSVFELRAAKRGKRLGWREKDGTPVYVKYIGHANGDGVICWREIPASEIPVEMQPRKRHYTADDVMAHVPAGKPISKDILRNRANRSGVPWNKINGFIDELLGDERLHEWLVPRPNTRPQLWLCRRPQGENELPLP